MAHSFQPTTPTNRLVHEFLSRNQQRISWLKCRQPTCHQTRNAQQIAEQIVDTSVQLGRARGSLPGQRSTTRQPAQSNRQRFNGRIWHMPAGVLYGFIEFRRGRRATNFLAGSCKLGDNVTFAVGSWCRWAGGFQSQGWWVGG